MQGRHRPQKEKSPTNVKPCQYTQLILCKETQQFHSKGNDFSPNAAVLISFPVTMVEYADWKQLSEKEPGVALHLRSPLLPWQRSQGTQSVRPLVTVRLRPQAESNVFNLVPACFLHPYTVQEPLPRKWYQVQWASL